MTHRVLLTYLNDHLGGAVAALELLDHLLALPPQVDEHLLTRLRKEIEQDQKVLQALIKDLGGQESTIRKAAAWLGEKMGQLKLRVDDPDRSELVEFESLETLALGIQGKLSLWRALAAVADQNPALSSLDLAELQARARDQFERAEQLRIQAARRALQAYR
jgi:hypothetical protein